LPLTWLFNRKERNRFRKERKVYQEVVCAI